MRHTLDNAPEEKKKRTDKLLAHWRDKPNEYSVLHGILCMPHAFNFWVGGDEGQDAVLAEGMFNYMSIAERLDELRTQMTKALV